MGRKYCPNGGTAFAGRLGWGTMMVPLRALLIAANRMVKPKTSGCGGQCPLGAEMRSSGLAFFRRREKYCHNGGMARAHHTAAVCRGPKQTIMAPSRGPPKRPFCRGKADGVRGPWPLGAAMRSSALRSSAYTKKYCPNGAWPSPTGCERREPHASAPFCSPQTPWLSQTLRGAGMTLLWGRRWARLPFEQTRPRRGHGLHSLARRRNPRPVRER